ncbi:MAG: hypothetical protein ACETWD_01495 [Desulfatiglandales bacterium]
MRNVITLSDIPKDLHDWLKKEAARRSRQSGKRVGIYQVVIQAVQELKEKIEKPSRRRGIDIPIMEIFRKKIQPSELRRGCICVPKTQQSRFGIGNTITMRDADDGSTILVSVQSQHRLNMRNWYNRHSKVKPGDEIIFEQQTDGFINVKVIAI